MCNYCNGKPKFYIAENFDLKIEGNKLIADYDAYSTDSSFSEEIQINYCPMCGRKL